MSYSAIAWLNLGRQCRSNNAVTPFKFSSGVRFYIFNSKIILIFRVYFPSMTQLKKKTKFLEIEENCYS